ncbi:MAG: sterol carrier family protein [Ancrocorticia sp.]|uniref:sterol carrier family protein n=1 Tax=Ancrocorticia sp. TaxID=2593684 RepID=UPI003F906F5A
MARRIDVQDGMPLLGKAAAAGVGELSKSDAKTAARFCLEEIAERHPGHSVEIRVPFAGATQAIEGPKHRRGTPPNVVEMDVATWLRLCVGEISWEEAVGSASVAASGIRADLQEFLPLFTRAVLGRW